MLNNQKLFEFTKRKEEFNDNLRENKDQLYQLASQIQLTGQLLQAIEDEYL